MSITRQRLLTVRQVAVLCHRSPKTVRRWLRAGDIPGARKVKDGWLVPEAALERFLDAGVNDET
ncbi:MAG: helix-turn-helix domain-containing protein [Polyangiaceae bacterium]|nr:helix-turn-helix domain-containing protein [Polyangiaceae bacterium]